MVPTEDIESRLRKYECDAGYMAWKRLKERDVTLQQVSGRGFRAADYMFSIRAGYSDGVFFRIEVERKDLGYLISGDVPLMDVGTTIADIIFEGVSGEGRYLVDGNYSSLAEHRNEGRL